MAGKAEYSLSDGVATVTLSDPATKNAIDAQMALDIRAGIERAQGQARVLVITGDGAAFSSGANLQTDFGGDKESGGQDLEILAKFFNPIVSGIRESGIPVITALNGIAVGVGASIALMGDLILASENSAFLFAFRHRGLASDGGATYLLPRMVTRARAMELLLLGNRLDARKALDWGLINYVFPADSFKASVAEVVEELALGPKSLGYIREGLWQGLDNSWMEQLRLEAALQGKASDTEDFKEGVAAFFDKRPVVFHGC